MILHCSVDVTHIMIYNQIIPETYRTSPVNKIDWVVQTVREHVVAQHALTGGDKGVGIYESADFGVVITGL